MTRNRPNFGQNIRAFNKEKEDTAGVEGGATGEGSE
jgi:hypothetical protein